MCVLFSPYAEEDYWESGSWDTDTYQHSVSDILQDHLALEACRSSGHLLGNDPGGKETEPTGSCIIAVL